MPCYDNPGSSVGLALGSGVYAGNVINEFLGQTQKLRFLRYPSLTPPHTRKDQPSGWSFLHCMQMGLARLALPQIASAAHGFDMLGNLGAELSAQAAHMHIDRAAAAVIVEAPHL